MKLYISKEEREVGSEKEVYFKFRHGTNGDIIVYVCNEKGEPLPCGNLIAFFPDGTMRKMSGVSGELGFQLKMGGQIQERRDC